MQIYTSAKCLSEKFRWQEEVAIAFFFFFVSLGPHPQPMEVPRWGVESELQLPVYATATATATPDLSWVCNRQHSSWQHRILQSTKWGQGSNLHPHGYQSGSLLLSHNGNSCISFLKSTNINCFLCTSHCAKYPVCVCPCVPRMTMWVSERDRHTQRSSGLAMQLLIQDCNIKEMTNKME